MNKIKEFLNSPEVNRLKEIFKLFNNNDNLKLPKTPLNKNDYEYMKSLSAAVVFSSSKKLHWVLISFVLQYFYLLLGLLLPKLMK